MRVVGVGLVALLGVAVPGLFLDWPAPPAPVAAAPAASTPAFSEYEWSTRAEIRDVAFEVQAYVPQRTDCRLDLAAAGRTADGGPEYVKVVRTDAGRAWSSMSVDGTVQVHAAGLVDTRDIEGDLQGEQWAARATHRRPDLQGNLSWFVAARHLSPWPGHEWSGADSLRFRFACQAPFEIRSVLAATDARLLSEHSLDGGQGVFVGPVGALVRQDAIRVEMGSDEARMMIGQFANEGQVSIETPQGTSSTALTGMPGFASYTHGPGTYGLGLDCLCRGTLWGVLADLRSVASLDDVLRPAD